MMEEPQNNEGTPKTGNSKPQTPTGTAVATPPNMAVNLTPTEEALVNAKAYLLKASNKSNLNL